MDFGNEEITTVVANETKGDDEDVEVKHTIVVSTRLKNNNRRGLHGRGEGKLLQFLLSQIGQTDTVDVITRYEPVASLIVIYKLFLFLY